MEEKEEVEEIVEEIVEESVDDSAAEEVHRVYEAMQSFKIIAYGMMYMVIVSTASLYFAKGDEIQGPNRPTSDMIMRVAGILLLLSTGLC
jgi:hypothetical protein